MKQKKITKVKKGISLIVLIITIIVVIILAAAVILSLSKDGGIINKARFAKDEYNKIEYRDRINEAYTIVKNKQEMQGKTDREIFEEVKKSLNFDKAKYEISDKSMNITTKEGYEYTLTGDGNVYDEKVAILDIAEGTILLDKDGYIQDSNPKVIYSGKYIITGTAKEKYVRVRTEGTYDITIKDLNIDMSTLDYGCPFNANGKATGCFVNLTIEGNNVFQGGSSGPGLGFTGAVPNIDGVTDGSTLTIQGNGNLEARGGNWGAGIGSGYGYASNNNALGNVNNIIINSGTITAIGRGHGNGIGSSLRTSVNNIIINGGNINANGIGSSNYGYAADNIIINGGKISVYASTCGVTLGGGSSSSGLLKINGGEIISTSKIGMRCSKVIINGGIIKSIGGISCDEEGNINITGGNILAKGSNNINIATYSGSSLISYVPTNGTKELYLTQIKLQNIGENKKIESITTSDNIEYGIKDMYTLEEGMLYMYLPLGKREITIKVDGKTYKGEVETKEEGNITVLSEM